MRGFMANRIWNYDGRMAFLNDSADKNFDVYGGGVNGTNATTGVLIYPESGSFAGGSVTLYGVDQ